MPTSGIEIDTTEPRVIPGPYEEGCPPPPLLLDPGRSLEFAAYPYVYPVGLKIHGYALADFTRTGLLLSMRDGALLAAADSWRYDDITAQVSPDVLSIIGSDLTYVSPVEPHSALQALGHTPSFLGVGECGEPGVHRFSYDGALIVQDLGIPLRVDLDDRLAFSVLEDAVYFGGDSTIERLDLGSGEIDILNFNAHPPSSPILGLAYDPGVRTLYILDVSAGEARLRAHELATGASNLLWVEPYVGNFDYTSLDVAEDGHLLLTLGTTQAASFWRIHRQTGERLGQVAIEGALLRLPTMGLHNLGVLYRDDSGKLRQQDLAAWRFAPGGDWGPL